MDDEVICCVCDLKVVTEKVKKVEVKDKVKDVCNECVTAITGLM